MTKREFKSIVSEVVDVEWFKTVKVNLQMPRLVFIILN